MTLRLGSGTAAGAAPREELHSDCPDSRGERAWGLQRSATGLLKTHPATCVKYQLPSLATGRRLPWLTEIPAELATDEYSLSII